MRFICIRSPLVAAGIIVLAALPAAASQEGFGLTKRTVKVTRVNPPRILLTGTKISVQVSSQNASEKNLAQQLQTLVESELIGNDHRLLAELRHPDIAVEVTILTDQEGESWENRSVLGNGINGKGKALLQLVPVQAPYKVVTHTFSAAYKVTDALNGGNLDADTLQYKYSEAFLRGSGAPSAAALVDNAMHRAAHEIAGRLTPTHEEIGLLLPKGSLEEAGNFAEANLWNKYLEALEALPARPKPVEESYRQYAIGVAYEALGYAAENSETTLKYLEQASSYYNSALAANPGEKLFALAYDSLFSGKTAASPVERVQSALAAYRKIQQFKENGQRLQAAAGNRAVAGGKSLDNQTADDGLVDNSAVIRMVKAGLSEDIILTAIDSARHRSFDLSPTGLIALSDANVAKGIIQHMQQDKNPKPRKPATKPAGSKKSTGL